MFDRKAVILCAPLLLFLSLLVAPGMAAGTAGETGPARVAVLPFAIHTPASLSFLQSGVRDMLSSRLSWQGKVQVADKSETDKVCKDAKEISQSEAVRIGAALKADYVLYGSITSTGQSVSIEAKMASVSGKTEPVSFLTQAKSLDDVMPQVDLFAQQINQKVFGKPEEKTQTASAEAEALATRNPELLLSGAAGAGGKIAHVNPKSVETTVAGSVGQSGFWKSQDFQGAILGMDVGDVDGDGKAEIVTIQARKLTVYKKENQTLREVATFEGSAADRFAWVSVAEVYSEGKSYIYLTNLRTKHSPSLEIPGTPISFLGDEVEVSSYVLAFSDGKLQVLAQGIPFYLNAIYLGQRGKVIVGQKQGNKSRNAFNGGMYEMQLRGGDSLAPGPEVSAPKEANLFNFAKADLNNQKADKIILVDDSRKLRVMSTTGDQVWKGDGVWAGTTNAFESKAEGPPKEMSDLYTIPSPILVVDLRLNGIPEIVANRNAAAVDKWLPNSTKYYAQGEIVSLSWDNMKLAENWKTKELDGQVTALRIGDIEGNGKKQLVFSTVYAEDPLRINDSKSVIFTCELNVIETSAKPAPDENETVPIVSDKPVPKPGDDKPQPIDMNRGRF
jgi:TolB-like protein